MKKILSILMLACLLLTMLPMAVLAEETQAAAAREPGACGDNLTWSYNDGTLTISGSGEMDDYTDAAPPWADRKHDIKKLVFTGGVTYVGANAFTDYDQLEEVHFGDAMHTVGHQAFYLCDGLTQIILPASFRCFGQESFMGCENLESVYCLGGMPSFKGSCLWDTYATVYFPTNNAWPGDAVQQLLNSYQFKITIQPGTAPAQETLVQETVAETQATEPAATETQPETTEEATAAATEPVETTEATQEATEETQAATRMTEPEWLYETYGVEEEPETEERSSLSMGLLVGICIVLVIFCLILIGALVFRRRNY